MVFAIDSSRTDNQAFPLGQTPQIYFPRRFGRHFDKREVVTYAPSILWSGPVVPPIASL